MKTKPIYYGTIGLTAVLLFFSNFLGTDLFGGNIENFTAWFVLSIFLFVCGWLINKTLGWGHGGKVLFATVIGTVAISVIMITLFSDYFGAQNYVSENILLFTLRNVTLGAIGFFGMSVSETLRLQNNYDGLVSQNENVKKELDLMKKEYELKVREASMKVEKMVSSAEADVKKMDSEKERIKKQLKEFILAERELIRKYESEK